MHYPLDVQIYSNYSEDLERKLDSYRLRGEFSVGMYSYDVGLGGYKVRRNLDPDRWDVLQLEPMRTGPQPSEVAEFWLADCTRPVLFKHLLCTVQTSFRGHAVFFNLIDQNLRLKESVSSLVRHELESAYREAAR